MATTGPEVEVLKRILAGDLQNIDLETMDFYLTLMQAVHDRLKAKQTQTQAQTQTTTAPLEPRLVPVPPPMPTATVVNLPPRKQKLATSNAQEKPIVPHHNALSAKLKEIKSQLGEDNDQLQTGSTLLFSRLNAIESVEMKRASYHHQRAAERADPQMVSQFHDQVLAVVLDRRRMLKPVPAKPQKTPDELVKDQEMYAKLEAMLMIEDIVASFIVLSSTDETAQNYSPRVHRVHI